MYKKVLSSTALGLFVTFAPIAATTSNQMEISAATSGFYDIPSSYWASKEINYLSSRSIITGYHDAKGDYFAPGRTLTRAQAAKMIVIAKGEKEATVSKSRFPDVAKDYWAAGWIERAAQLNIFDGKQNGMFEPEEALTRQQMTKVLVKAFGLSVKDDKIEPFVDVYINDEFRPYVSTLYQLGIATGNGDRFNPKDSINRSQFSAFLARTLNTSFRVTPKPPTQTKPDSQPAQPSQTAIVTASTLNVRSGPSTSYEVIGQLSKGNKVNVYSVEGSWTKVQYGSQTGYTSTSYLNIGGTTTNPTPNGSVVENRIIVLDAGHGGKDPGTSGNELFEKEITLDVEKRLSAKLKAAGANVILTRSGDTYPTLGDRVEIAKKNNADIFVSIHANSGSPSANGTETYYDTSQNASGGESKQLADEIQKQIIALVGMNSRGTKDEDFYVLRNNDMPSVLIELGFVTNKQDAEKLSSDKYRDLFAEAIYRGIVKYYE